MCSDNYNKEKGAVDIEESMWTLDQDLDGTRDAFHTLIISLARPADERNWKQGEFLVRQLS